MRPNVELTGATLPYRAASRGRREQRFCRRLRNTVLDPAHSHDRQLDRQLLADIRGYGPIRERYAAQAGERRKVLWQDFTLGRQPGGNRARGKGLKIPAESR